ncbi:MAG: adenosine deaminase, partial [Myxococcota bacterium]
GSIRPQTLLDLARVARLDPIAKSADAVIGALGAGQVFDSLPHYLELFSHTLPVMQRAPALRRIAHELVEDAARDGVHHVEVRFCPDLHVGSGLSLDAVMEAVCVGLQEGQRRFAVSWGLIVTALRQEPAERSEALAQLAAQWSERGVVGFDLAGKEDGYPCSVHQRAFEIAKDAGLGLTIHAGEVTGPATIAAALERGAERIGHGTNLRDDPALLERFREERIPLEMCPSSNVQTRSVTGYEDNPALDYLRGGLEVTINTDSRLISNTTVTDELMHLRRAHAMSWDEAKRLAQASFRAAFVDESRREELIARVPTMAARLEPVSENESEQPQQTG